MLSKITLSLMVECCYAECHLCQLSRMLSVENFSAECHYAECCCAKCRGDVPLLVALILINLLSVIFLSMPIRGWIRTLNLMISHPSTKYSRKYSNWLLSSTHNILYYIFRTGQTTNLMIVFFKFFLKVAAVKNFNSIRCNLVRFTQNTL